MSTEDATLNQSVSAEAEEKAQKQNNAVAQTEVEAAATVSTETAVNNSELELEIKPEVNDEPKLSPREEKMAKIAENRKKQQEQGSQPELSNEDLGLPDDYQEDQGGKVTLKVGGKEKEVSAEKVMDAGVRALQKESNADVKLEDAGKKEKAADLRMDQLNVREQNLLNREQEFKASKVAGDKKPSAAADVSGQDELSDDEADEIVDDLYSGDKKKARDAVKEIDNRARGNAATPAEESHPVTAEEVATLIERKAEAKNSLKRFNTAYPDIAADQNLKTIVNTESLRIRSEHPEYTQEELLMESGKFVAKKYGSRIVDETGFQEKAARKTQTDTVAGADVTRRPKQEKQPTTRKQVVADLRAGRR